MVVRLTWKDVANDPVFDGLRESTVTNMVETFEEGLDLQNLSKRRVVIGTFFTQFK